MNYWLMKSEPDVFSIEHLRKAGVNGWDGVRNFQARNFMRQMRKGDLGFFYHSNAKPSAIAGVFEVAREAYPDPCQFDPKSDYYDARSTPDKPLWDQVDVRFKKAFKHPMSLDEIRGIPALKAMVLLHRGRLSVQPVAPSEWKTLEKILV